MLSQKDAPASIMYMLCDLPQLDPRPIVLISQTNKRRIIWHERLGHLKFWSLKSMTTQNMVSSLPKVLPPDAVYRECVLGKHQQVPFESSKAWWELNLLELIHSDLYCINQPSLSCAKYIFTFIDDLSIFTWVYFLKNKSHIF